MGQVRRFPTDTSCHITVQPVIDPHNATPVDGYEIPRRIRDAMFLRMPASWTTPRPTCRPPEADRRVKPASTTSAR
jgi:hypothetical protein